MRRESCPLVDWPLLHERIQALSDEEQARHLLWSAIHLLEEAAYATARAEQEQGAKLYLFHLATEAEKQLDRLEGRSGRRE